MRTLFYWLGGLYELCSMAWRTNHPLMGAGWTLLAMAAWAVALWAATL